MEAPVCCFKGDDSEIATGTQVEDLLTSCFWDRYFSNGVKFGLDLVQSGTVISIGLGFVSGSRLTTLTKTWF